MNNFMTSSFGKFKKWFLGKAEFWIYDLVGMPMAISAHRSRNENSNYIHHFYQKEFWRLPFGPIRFIITAALWPFALILAITIFTVWNGRVIANRHGISIANQIAMQIKVAFKYSIAPFWFYMFELYDPKRNLQAPDYLLAHETIGPAFSALQPLSANDNMPDKVWFAAYCREKNIRAVPVFLFLSNGKINPALSETSELPPCDLFVKPRQGNGGHNAERWDYFDRDMYKNSQGQIFNRDELLATLLKQSLQDDFIIQPRLVNHPALTDISNDALSTVRVFTIRNELGEPEVTNVAFRMAIGTNSVVDNFHQGGLAASINLQTGKIGEASDIGLKPDMGWRDIHPTSGIRFMDRILPDWSDVLELARSAHRAFPDRVMVGWDVAMLNDGPMIIEGNGKPDLDIHQRVERAPLGAARVAELIVFNLQKHVQRIKA
jgi:Sugar-transfer associated ATP-grasp